MPRSFLSLFNESFDNNSPVTKADLDRLERYCDAAFGALGLDVSFTRHFLDRVNDPRNGKQITYTELMSLFNKEYAQQGKRIAGLSKNAEAVMKDMKSDINVPFVLDFNDRSGMIELRAKTVMRKKNFKTPDRVFEVR